jgi:hypothetical protein
VGNQLQGAGKELKLFGNPAAILLEMLTPSDFRTERGSCEATRRPTRDSFLCEGVGDTRAAEAVEAP